MEHLKGQLNAEAKDGTSDQRRGAYKHLQRKTWLKNSLGTLGGGNHFIEIDRGEDGTFWLVIRSGSRNLGKQVCEYYRPLQ